ncbi:MAG: hypothetical protein JNM80_05800 [Phycisphaerae bacterium]|nr:hypothetical protein [Phycisphaerae bacterium]
MPLYEYEAEDGTVVELLRPAKDADKPVPDPEGKGRVFTRKHSVFASGGAGGAGGHVHTGSCACGKRQGGCGAG